MPTAGVCLALREEATTNRELREESWLHIPCALKRLNGEERDRTGKPFELCGLELPKRHAPLSLAAKPTTRGSAST